MLVASFLAVCYNVLRLQTSSMVSKEEGNGVLLKIILALPLLILGGIGALSLYGAHYLIRRRTPDVQASPVEYLFHRASPADYGLPFEEVAFPSRDGIPLQGWFIPAPQPKATIVFCHGVMGSMDPDLRYAPWFHERGYNVLMFDFRGHGRSGGDHISWGYHERQDLLGAIDYLHSRGIHRVGVMGFSLGGAVAMITAPQSPAIRAVVSDGGFAQVRKAIEGGLRTRYNLRLLHIPLSTLIVRLAGWRLGRDLSEADPIRWVSQISPRALLIIHGGQDPYVPTADARRLYEQAGEPKELWIVPEAGHREVDLRRPEEYRERVLGFFDRWLGGSEDD